MDILGFFLIALFGGALGTLAIVKALFLVNFQHLTVVIILQKLQPIFAIISLTSGSGAILLYYFGLKRVKAIVSTICELCFPVSAIIFDYAFNDKIMSPIQWISAVI